MIAETIPPSASQLETGHCSPFRRASSLFSKRRSSQFQFPSKRRTLKSKQKYWVKISKKSNKSKIENILKFDDVSPDFIRGMYCYFYNPDNNCLLKDNMIVNMDSNLQLLNCMQSDVIASWYSDDDDKTNNAFIDDVIDPNDTKRNKYRDNILKNPQKYNKVWAGNLNYIGYFRAKNNVTKQFFALFYNKPNQYSAQSAYRRCVIQFDSLDFLNGYETVRLWQIMSKINKISRNRNSDIENLFRLRSKLNETDPKRKSDNDTIIQYNQISIENLERAQTSEILSVFKNWEVCKTFVTYTSSQKREINVFVCIKTYLPKDITHIVIDMLATKCECHNEKLQIYNECKTFCFSDMCHVHEAYSKCEPIEIDQYVHDQYVHDQYIAKIELEQL